MGFLRFLILTMVIALGTVLVAWWVVPVAGAAYGLLGGRGRPALVAAAAGAAAWGGYLSILSFGGAPVTRFAGDLAHAMTLPSWAPHVATLAFPALLAGSAAALTARWRRPDTKRR
ncbi:MAG: hypothetical protein IT361_08890 [Gemmatimonadaceae bacterium]|nr:hypothetical protein [Gemmatimonadaceae bacterium]